MTINNIDTLDGFYPVSEDIKKLSLCVYLADITYCILGMNNPDSRMLHLFLNSVYALAYRDEPMADIRHSLMRVCHAEVMRCMRLTC